MSAVYAEEDLPRTSGWPWLIVAATMVLVAVLLLLGHRSFRAVERSAVAEFTRRQLLVAREATHGIEFYFRALTRSLFPLARDEHIVGFDGERARHDLRLKAEELERFGVWDVWVLDSEGILRFSAKDNPMEGADFSERRYFREAREATSSEVPVVEFVEFEARGPGARGFLVGVPIFGAGEGDGGRFAGLVCCVLDAGFLTREFVEPARASRRGHSMLLDDRGYVLWCADPSRFGKLAASGAERFPALRGLLARMLAGEKGAGEFEFYRFEEAAGRYGEATERKLMAFAPARVGRHSWSIAVWAPRADALELVGSAYRAQHLELGFTLLVVVAGCFLALGLFSRVSAVLERRVVEKSRALREAHDRLLKVLDGLDALVYVADMESGEVLFVNRYGRELFGEAAGATCWQVFQAGQDGPCRFCTNDRLLDERGEPAGVVVWEHENTANGRWYEHHDRALRWHDGRMVRLDIAYDVTERRAQRERIVAQNVELRRRQREIEASRRELAAAADQVSRLIDQAARGQTMDLSYENPHLVACWRVRQCAHTWCPCHGREAVRCWQVEGTLCDREKDVGSFAEKVIRCRECEVYRRSCPDRLTELAEEFNNMMFLLRRKSREASQLRYHALQQERMAAIGTMAAGIAHEIGNPLASLFSLVQVLAPSLKDREDRAKLATMRRCIERISKIVREVVDFGRPVGSEEWVYGDVEKIALDTINLLRYDRRARGVEIAVDFEPRLPKTMVVEHELQQVFMNIMLNALDAMGGHGRLAVRGRRADNAIEVAISDTGEGIRPEDIRHIFEPFYSRKAASRGTGLGLALSYNIIQRHGGTIRVASRQGAGTTFVVSLPVRGPALAAEPPGAGDRAHTLANDEGVDATRHHPGS